MDCMPAVTDASPRHSLRQGGTLNGWLCVAPRKPPGAREKQCHAAKHLPETFAPTMACCFLQTHPCRCRNSSTTRDPVTRPKLEHVFSGSSVEEIQFQGCTTSACRAARAETPSLCPAKGKDRLEGISGIGFGGRTRVALPTADMRYVGTCVHSSWSRIVTSTDEDQIVMVVQNVESFCTRRRYVVSSKLAPDREVLLPCWKGRRTLSRVY